MKTEAEIRNLLPIGSVAVLKNGKRPVMIYGVLQTDKESGKEYDYISVLWPEGNLGAGSSILFDHADIDKLLFRGAEGVNRDEFIEKLVAYYQSKAGEA